MDIRVNGEFKTVEQGLSLYQLLLDLQIDPVQPGIAVAMNQELISKKQWQETVVRAGSEVEIVHAVQGG
ncbi:MAG: sulfur carrier protein ThiS [Candidatus Poribacteria bacterium]|nr:sulfur carrier protein ThiS [Candidatus Poribacteria bacterium]